MGKRRYAVIRAEDLERYPQYDTRDEALQAIKEAAASRSGALFYLVETSYEAVLRPDDIRPTYCYDEPVPEASGQ